MLIELVAHDEVVFGYVIIALLLILGPLAYVSGVDSRIDERSRPDRHTR